MHDVWVEKKVHDKSSKTQLSRLVKQKRASGHCDVNIGKKGITPEVLNEIKRRLKAEKVVKVRILKSALDVTGMDRKGIAREVAARVSARLIEVRGRTFILVKNDA